MNFTHIYQELKKRLLQIGTSARTPSFTSAIVNFFEEKFASRIVLSHKIKQEYLYDICVMDFKPLDIYKNEKDSYKTYLVVESELGGTSASSAKLVERNVIEDFYKILQAIAKNKIFIGIYSSRKNETDALKNRIDKMFDIAKKTDNQTEMLIILIEGEHSGKSRQVEIKRPLNINGFVLSPHEYNSIDL